uniref:Uncharacterized protein n=1 Tax=Octopus bimaculoides TaxID=37653 RepID=A0A0L8FK12_OCTBM
MLPFFLGQGFYLTHHNLPSDIRFVWFPLCVPHSRQLAAAAEGSLLSLWNRPRFLTGDILLMIDVVAL